MNYNYLQQGGLTSIPARPVFRGQQHQLGYLTPNQSELLRRQGGGVTPSGGQYKGPGGLNTFLSMPRPEDRLLPPPQPPGPVNGLGGTTHRRWWSCFVAGAEILLDNHMVKKVEEVEKGDRVHGIDEQINTVKSLISTITGGRRLISINNGNYFTTEDHPFMVANGSWKSCNGKMSQEKYPELNVDQLQIGDKIKGGIKDFKAPKGLKGDLQGAKAKFGDLKFDKPSPLQTKGGIGLGNNISKFNISGDI